MNNIDHQKGVVNAIRMLTLSIIYDFYHPFPKLRTLLATNNLYLARSILMTMV